MPRRKRYKGHRIFVVPGGFARYGINTSATIEMRPATPPYEGYIDMPTAVLFDRPEIPGVTQIPKTVWFDDNVSREAAELYGVLKALRQEQAEILKASKGEETIVIKRTLIEGVLDVPKRTVQAWLEELIEAGHVTREQGHRGISSNYILNSG